MNRITCLVPRKSDARMGNRIFRVGEMRLLDLADLQAWLDDRWEDPLEALGASLWHLQDQERRKALLDIWDASEAGPIQWGTPQGVHEFKSAEGIIQTLTVILNQHHLELVQGAWVDH